MTEKQTISWLKALSHRIEQEQTAQHKPGYAQAVSRKVVKLCRDEALIIVGPYIPMACEDWTANPELIQWLETIKQQTKELFDERVT